MTKMEEFKNFIKTKPELVKYVQNGEMTWQKFYEIYDLYGSDNIVWSKYQSANDVRVNNTVSDGLNKITSLMKNMDMESIKSHINTAQKAIDFMTDFTTKKATPPSVTSLNKGPASPRPLNKFFED